MRTAEKRAFRMLQLRDIVMVLRAPTWVASQMIDDQTTLLDPPASAGSGRSCAVGARQSGCPLAPR
jgi:hypothetical protein